MEKWESLTNQRAGQCLAFQHQMSPTAPAIITSVTEKCGKGKTQEEGGTAAEHQRNDRKVAKWGQEKYVGFEKG